MWCAKMFVNPLNVPGIVLVGVAPIDTMPFLNQSLLWVLIIHWTPKRSLNEPK